MTAVNCTPWPAALRLALSLGIPPEAFWRLSLKEWRALTAAGEAPMRRDQLKQLQARFPDDGAKPR